jgi:hypothetical protein
MFDEGGTCFCGLNTLTTSVEKRQSHALFQFGNLFAQSRLRNRQPVCGTRKVEFFR